MSLIYCINTVWKDMMQFCTSCTFAPADFHLYPPGNKQAWRPLAHDQCWCCSVVLLEHRQLWWILSTSDLIGVLKFPGISFKQFMWWISQCRLLLLKTDCCVAVCPTEASFAYKPWFFFFNCIHFCSLNSTTCSWKLFFMDGPEEKCELTKVRGACKILRSRAIDVNVNAMQLYCATSCTFSP